MQPTAYFDHNAGAPLRKEVKEALLPYLEGQAYILSNPSSPHQNGQKARAKREEAREFIANCFHVKADDVIFTASGTEANNLALHLKADLKAEGALLIPENAHDSLKFALTDSAKPAQPVKIDAAGKIDRDLLKQQLENAHRSGHAPALMALLWVNNETGVIEDIAEVARLISHYGVKLHIDGVQAVGRCALDIIIGLAQERLVHSFGFSGHKLGALAGIGALILFDRDHLTPLIQGGGQEHNFRAGTENLLGIIALHHALFHALTAMGENRAIEKLRDDLEASLCQINQDAIIVGKNSARIGNTTQLISPGLTSQQQLIGFDLQGYRVSSGAACSSGKIGANDNLIAHGFDEKQANSAIRISLGQGNHQKEIDGFLEIYRRMVESNIIP